MAKLNRLSSSSVEPSQSWRGPSSPSLVRSDVSGPNRLSRPFASSATPSATPQNAATPEPSSTSTTNNTTFNKHGGKAGIGLGQSQGLNAKRHRKVLRDNILGVTHGDIRRMARRGGVKRISATVYPEARVALRTRLVEILRDIVAVIESSGRKTVTVTDVVFVLNRLGRPIYGFGIDER